ncbi:putative sporulation protein YyaC [Cytobacillus eiseniae]|uniref:Sporulation protein YyaC n=1 Tax=Cytobacillus eiseniae TaxID=762947 RepID=A0ABS4RJS9_9BACI|nr:spore protease YyaC [Cytobacillus eiseniae]MBP2243157.1 putative sporulation protein YyaC [Cytobacillus eiseniae]
MNIRNNLFDKKDGNARIPYDEKYAAIKLANEVVQLLPTSINNRPIVFVCIGTDRSTGDSLGPLVGTLLEEKKLASFFVYGTLEDPVHAVNLAEKLEDINRRHFNPFIIGIDACLGRLKSVGVIQVGEGAVKPGAGVNKELPEVGHMHITGIVNVSGFMEFFVLQNTRLHLVLNMAKTIANSIYKASLLYEPKPIVSAIKWDRSTELEKDTSALLNDI